MFRGPASPYGSPSHSASTEGSTETVEPHPAADPLLAGLERPRSLLVAGASGFVGGHVVSRLVSRGHRVRALSRSPLSGPRRERVEWVRADVTDPDTLRGVAEDQDGVIHLVGIAEERSGQTFGEVHVTGTRNLLDEARRAGVERFILMSAAGARREGSPFFRTKFEAERAVAESGLVYVIFRPSVIYGPGDRFTTALEQLLRRLPVFPVLGVGSLRLQPVAVEDVTDALAQAAERADLDGDLYELAGPERLKFTKIVRIVARSLELRRPVVQLPGFLARPALRMAGWLGLPEPLTPQQLEFFREASLFSKRDNALRTVFRVEPLPFRDAVGDYL